MVELRTEYAHLPLHRVGEAAAVAGPPIALCVDEKFAFEARVALASIFLNSPSRSLDLVVFAVDWRDGTLALFDAFARRFGRPLTIVRVVDAMLPQSLTSAYLPRLIFFKFLMPEIFEGDRFLYLDADIIAQVDLEEIWRDYRDDMPVGGVADIAAREWKRRLGSPEPEIYINTGVLLINNRRWREERVLARCAEWLGNNRKQAVFASQDFLNNALPGGIYLIPGRWNVTRNNQPQDWRLDPDSFRGILHFAGRAKPWMRWTEPALQDFYLHYARIVGIPAGYWVEARLAREALAEAFWAEQQGNFAKANAIHKHVAEAALAKLRELNPGVTVELP